MEIKKTLKLATFRPKLTFNINHGMADICLRDIVDETRSGRKVFDFDVFLKTKGKNLQRPLVWTLFQKQQLILSVLKGVKIPVISVVFVNHEYFKVIDGKQRLNALISFAKGEFPIIVDDVEYFFDDLDKEAQQELLWKPIYADIGYEYDFQPISDDVLITWFEMINFSGTPQDEEHLKNLKL